MDQDFTDLCSRLLKRVRKRGASGDKKRPATKDEEQEPSSPSSRRKPPKRRRKKTDMKHKLNGRTQPVSQPAPEVSGSGRVKDTVIQRMQRFKRASPERLLHAETDGNHLPTAGIQRTEDVSSDEALALQLQQALDREARSARDVEDEGLFFCQFCQKDLSTMSPPLCTQHINRCLDASESSAASASRHPPPRPRVPQCPICGKSFKSEKSRSVHLKRCSTDMGVKPNDLLQALRRQAAETVSDYTTHQSQQLGSGAITQKESQEESPEAGRGHNGGAGSVPLFTPAGNGRGEGDTGSCLTVETWSRQGPWEEKEGSVSCPPSTSPHPGPSDSTEQSAGVRLSCSVPDPRLRQHQPYPAPRSLYIPKPLSGTKVLFVEEDQMQFQSFTSQN